MLKLDYHIILASNSPRRRELLSGLGLDYEVRTLPGIDESYPDTLQGEEIPVYISSKKASAYLDALKDNELLITADTIVWLDGRVLGKPADEDEACQMLRDLSGKTHQVITGVTPPSRRVLPLCRKSPSPHSPKKKSAITSPTIIPWIRPVPTACKSG